MLFPISSLPCPHYAQGMLCFDCKQPGLCSLLAMATSTWSAPSSLPRETCCSASTQKKMKEKTNNQTNKNPLKHKYILRNSTKHSQLTVSAHQLKTKQMELCLTGVLRREHR